MTGESKYCVAASVMLNRTTKCAPLVALKTCRVITVLLTFLVNTEMSRELHACVRVCARTSASLSTAHSH